MTWMLLTIESRQHGFIFKHDALCVLEYQLHNPINSTNTDTGMNHVRITFHLLQQARMQLEEQEEEGRIEPLYSFVFEAAIFEQGSSQIEKNDQEMRSSRTHLSDQLYNQTTTQSRHSLSQTPCIHWPPRSRGCMSWTLPVLPAWVFSAHMPVRQVFGSGACKSRKLISYLVYLIAMYA